MKNNAWRERGSWLGSVRALDLRSCFGAARVKDLRSWLRSARALDLRSCTALGSKPQPASRSCLRSPRQTRIQDLRSYVKPALKSASAPDLRSCFGAARVKDLRSWLRSARALDLRSCTALGSKPQPASRSCLRSPRQTRIQDLRSISAQDLRSCPTALCRLRSKRWLRSPRSGFTLIEVLVSVMIIALVGTALLELSTKSVRIVSFLKQKEELPFMVAFAANHYGADDENLDKNFLDGVEKFYRIDSARLKGFLNKNAVYSKDLAERIYFDDNSSALGQIEIHKHSVKTKTAVAYLYRIEIPRTDLNITK
ncbi:MAG: type II secretion system protein [Helicobacteraceae bacterium]